MKSSKMFIRHALCGLALCLAGCDATIHQYPRPAQEDAYKGFVVQLHADRTPPLFYKEIVYDADGNRTETVLEDEASPSYVPNERMMMRFVVEVRDHAQTDADGNAAVVERRELTVDNDALPPQAEMTFTLPAQGQYTAVSWCDYVPASDPVDWHFSTGSLHYIEEDLEHTVRNNHHKSSATGYTLFLSTDEEDGVTVSYADVTGTRSEGQTEMRQLSTNTVPVYMARPSARLRLYTDDLQEFLQAGNRIEDVRVVIIYKQYISMAYNALEQTTCQWISTRRMETRPSVVDETGHVCLAYDYILVDNDEENHVLADFYFLDADGNELTHTTDVDIPLWRNRETVIRSRFLTRNIGEGGVGIDEGFDGEFVVPLN